MNGSSENGLDPMNQSSRNDEDSVMHSGLCVLIGNGTTEQDGVFKIRQHFTVDTEIGVPPYSELYSKRLELRPKPHPDSKIRR